VLGVVPAWLTNRLERLVKMPKRYLIDSGLAAGLAGLDAAAVMKDVDLIGRLLDTLVAAELRAELPCAPRARASITCGPRAGARRSTCSSSCPATA